MLTSSSSHHCTLRALLTKCQSICIHTSPPPMPDQRVVELRAREMTAIDTSVVLVQELLSHMVWNCHPLAVSMSVIDVKQNERKQ